MARMVAVVVLLAAALQTARFKDSQIKGKPDSKTARLEDRHGRQACTQLKR